MFIHLLLATLTLSASAAETPLDWAKNASADLLPLYKDLHSHPELSFAEKNTSAKIAENLRATGVEVTTGVGGYGVVGVLKNGNGPKLLIRTDLDALPLVENTGLEYASKVKTKNAQGVEVGVMHACGHDIHMTTFIGVARYLATHKDQWSGSVLFIGQPAEEKGAGAQAMLEAGLYKKFFKPDYALALHVDPSFDTQTVGYRSGPTFAIADSVDVSMRGRSGHGAMPHLTIDPVILASQFVVDLQSLISREKNPTDPAVITVGSFHCGTKHNLISDSCELQLTVRSATMKTRNFLMDGIKRKALATAMAFGAPEPVLKTHEGTVPGLYNDPQLVARLVPVFKKVLGEKNVVPADFAMVSEDFTRYSEGGVPIFLFRLGSLNSKRLQQVNKKPELTPTLHSAIYYPDAKETLETGITAMTAAALDLLSKPTPKS